MKSRIASLELRIRAAPERHADVRPVAEAFAADVLRRCDALLEALAPGRVLLLRELDLQLRLLDSALDVESEIDAFAAEIAGSLDARARAGPASPRASDELVVFADEANYRAAHLAARAAGDAHLWYFARLEEEGEAPGALTDADRRDVAEKVLRLLLARGQLVAALEALSPAGLARLAEALGAPDAGRASPSPSAHWTALLPVVAELPRDVAPPLAAIVLLTHARETLGGSAPQSEMSAAVGHALWVFLKRREGASSDVVATRDSAADPPTDGQSVAAYPSGGRRREPTVPAESTSEIAGVHPRDVVASDVPGVFQTEFAGLFYLLSIALELDVGEILFRAGVAEGAVLARVAAAILGPGAAGDLAPRLFGGAPADLPLGPTDPVDLTRASTELLARLVEAVPRRGLASHIAPTLALVPTSRGRLLVAGVLDGTFILFASPASTPGEVSSGLDAFLSAWPASAPKPRASPPLAALDGSARIEAERGSGLGSGVLLPEAEDAASAALYAQTAGMMAYLFAARAGALDVERVGDLADCFFRISGEIVTTDAGVMEIRMPMDRIDVRVRAAGLDRDPGWVPWLLRRVRVVYES